MVKPYSTIGIVTESKICGLKMDMTIRDVHSEVIYIAVVISDHTENFLEWVNLRGSVVVTV